MKKVLLMVIDALTARIIGPMLDRGQLPNMAALREAGDMRECVSIFPSITHAALSSLATGKYPREHGVVASYWYVAAKHEVAYYSGDPLVVWHEGIGRFYDDFIRKLNHERLQSETIFQIVERAGLHAACFNFLIFRGDVTHDVNLPLLMKLIPGFTDNHVTLQGPKTLYLGEFVNAPGTIEPLELDFASGVQDYFGFMDAGITDLLVGYQKAQGLPDFTLAYFPQNDYISHAEGPQAAHQKLTSFDTLLGQLYAAYGGLEAMLAEVAVLITGDHSQSDVTDNNPGIELAELLGVYKTAVAGETWRTDDEIMICANLRAVTFYLRLPDASLHRQVRQLLLEEPRIDQVLCRARFVEPGADGYWVASAGDELRFWPGDRAHDAYGSGWDWAGDLSVVDGHEEAGRLTFGDYPNAFERIAGCLDGENSGQLWATSRVGYEFTLPRVRIHAGGGSHGSLHRLDSVAPLISAGLPEPVHLPAQPRLVDVMPICLNILGLA